MTPHEGEAARLGAPYGIALADPSSVDARRAFAGALAACYESIVVLKGPVTIVAAPDRDHEAHVVDSGTAALAKAGTGDVLAGLIGGLLAQGVDPSTPPSWAPRFTRMRDASRRGHTVS